MTRRRLSTVLSVLVALWAFVCVPVSSRAQSTSATINGQVTDSQGRVVPSVQVQAINIETNVVYTGKTNDSGIYVIPHVAPGPYRLLVVKDGFKAINKTDVVLHLQDTLEQNFSLEVGSMNESVTVESGASMINTTDGSVSTIVDQTYVKNMPLNGRSFQDLILLTPGTVTSSPQTVAVAGYGFGQAGEFSVNGQRTESNYYTVDGVSANVGATAGNNMTIGAASSGSIASATALGTTQAIVSVDALQEFRVQSSTYSAEYGRNPGGQFVFETKSGTNQWHGTAFDYLRNGYFDATDWFNNYFRVKEPALRQNDFGGTLGGPVRIPALYNGKDRTFFFVSYEGLRLAAPQAATVNFVPDAALRASAPAPLNQVLNAFPQPSPNGVDDVANGIAQYIASWSNPASLDSTSLRFDHVVNDKLRIFFRFSDTTSGTTVRGTNYVLSPPTSNSITAYTMRTYTAGASSVFSGRLSNDFRLNYSSNEVAQRNVFDAFGGSTPIDLVQLAGFDKGSAVYVQLLFGGYLVDLSQSQTAGAQRQWNLVDSVSVSRGRHQLKFGVDYRRLAPFDVPINPQVLYRYTSQTAVKTNSGALVIAVAHAPAYPLYTNFSAFVQDQWRVSQRLSLSLGLRWEVNPPPGVTQGLNAYTVQGSSPDTLALAPQGTPLWRTTWYNFAPRLGAAYVVRNAPGRETVVRGGGGVFFDTGQQLGSVGFDPGPGFRIFKISRGSFPGSVVIPTIVNPPVSYSFAYGFAPHLQLPYTLHWNASIEQGLGKSQALTVTYLGSRAARLLQQNTIFPANNPNAAEFIIVGNGLTSYYNSLQIQFRRRLTRGLTALGSYTWSHCIDYGSTNFLFVYQRGNCDFDVRHNFSAAISYDLPNPGQSPFTKAVLHHWGVDGRFIARSSFPVGLSGAGVIDPLTGYDTSTGLDLVSSQPIYLYGANCASVLQGLGRLSPGQGCPGGWAINPCAFVAVGSTPSSPCPTNGTVGGLAPRNFLHGFGAWQTNLAVRREFPIQERLKLQFRAEAFNIFNHPNFGYIDQYTFDRTFGQATGTLANSLGVLNPLYQMGGPRSMQFALKLIF